MNYRRLGRSDLSVSDICLGTMTWGEQNSEAEGHAQMDYALDQGVNFFDTAEMYAVPPRKETYGRTEEIIGTWFESRGIHLALSPAAVRRIAQHAARHRHGIGGP